MPSTFSFRRIALSLLLVTGCGGGGSTPTEPRPGDPPAFASFHLAGGGQDGGFSYGGGDSISCRRNAGWASLWIQLARDPSGAGPRLDIDLCNHDGGGSFAPMDPRGASCGGGKTWDVWWHGEDGVFANEASSSPCTLNLTQSGTVLQGDFACHGLRETGGSRTVDVLAGSFRCSER